MPHWRYAVHGSEIVIREWCPYGSLDLRPGRDRRLAQALAIRDDAHRATFPTKRVTVDRITKDAQQAMATATDYRTWQEAAQTLDQHEGLNEWREDEASDDYDWRLIRGRLRQLQQLRREGDLPTLVHHLRQGLHWNIGNIGNPRLYAVARTGTKHLIHQYIESVVETLEFLAAAQSPDLPHAAKLKFFREVTQSFGCSALLLSGGATLGLFHVGVVKTIYQEGLLPSVLSGSSAGAVVAGAVGSRDDAGIQALLDAENAYYSFWRLLGPKAMWRSGSIMDPAQIQNAIARNIPDLTFEEARRISGRTVNITVSPAASNQPPRLLNHLTFPYLCLREAVAASCAVPLLFPPVMLMTRDAVGERVPYMPLLKWNDGTLKSDLPLLRMRRLHNINHFVVSQTNPHIIPFLSRIDRPARRKNSLVGARDLVRDAAMSQARTVVDVARALTPFTSLRRPLDAMAAILDQTYRGNVTIVPRNSVRRYMQMTANPGIDDVRRFILEGERATWPRMAQVRNQVRISQTLERCLARLERGESPAAANLRLVRPGA